jgi:hypothetical protein
VWVTKRGAGGEDYLCLESPHYRRGLPHNVILERHATNPQLNESSGSELHVAAQSTVCPPRTCADIDQLGRARRLVLVAEFHVEEREAYLCNGRQDLEAVATGSSEAMRRIDVVSRRIDQKAKEFART